MKRSILARGRGTALALLLACSLLLSGCGLLFAGVDLVLIGLFGESDGEEYALRRYARGDLGLDITGGEVTDFWDDHGGFHGDGVAFLEIRFEDPSLEESLSLREDWQPMPVSREVRALVYGLTEDTGSLGPYINSSFSPIIDKGNSRQPLVPEIENGYYLLVDRQPEEYRPKQAGEEEEPGMSILNRPSFNLTVGLYDADRDILYVLALDT